MALTNYSDWAGAHPGPGLVRQFCDPTANVYRYWVKAMEALVARGWHDYPAPTEVDFLGVVRAPSPEVAPDGGPLWRGTHRAYSAGVIEVVLRAGRDPYLNADGTVVGYSGAAGLMVVRISLAQGNRDGQFRFKSWEIIRPEGGTMAMERRLGARP
jgi:hypothetical protein